MKISNAILHFGEEPPLVEEGGSGAIFFSGCPMKCTYCQNMGFSQRGIGVEISEEELAFIMLKLQEAGAQNINLVTATHYIPQILKALETAALEGLKLPIVWNTSGYEDPNILKPLEGVVDIYLTDIRYTEDTVGKKYSKVPNYWSVTKEAIKEMFRQVGAFNGEKGVIVRILIFPNKITDHKKALLFIANELSKEVPVSIMRQYMPVFGAKKDPKINRGVTDEEFEEILSFAEILNLEGWYQLDETKIVPTKAVSEIFEFLKRKLISNQAYKKLL